MRSLDFVLTVRFWVFAWIVTLFVGLMPLPPVAELVILVGRIAHGVWFVQHRLWAIATRRAITRAEREEFRGRSSRRALRGDQPLAVAQPEPADPTHHWRVR